MDTNTTVILIIIIFALIIIGAFFRFRQRGKAEIKGPFGTSLSVQGSNEPSPQQAGITAKGITSREGGVLAEDNTGRGVFAESIDAKDDVLLSNNPVQVQTGLTNPNVAMAYPNTLSAQALTAGGNITIQQYVGSQISPAQQLSFFLQQLGLDNYQSSKFAASQFEAYSNIWKKLQALRLAGDNLWELASNENLFQFGEQLRQVKTLTLEDDIYFEDEHRAELKDVLRHFGRFYFGKEQLIEIRSRDILNEYMHNKYVQQEIQEHIQENLSAKNEYEQILEKIRKSFRNKLSTM